MKTRDILELLLMLRDYFPKSNLEERGALCFAINDMYEDEHLINLYECYLLTTYIKDHVPDDRKEYFYNKAYFWPEGELEPRMKFLNDLINAL